MHKLQKLKQRTGKITDKEAFLLFQSYGFPKELIEEEIGYSIDKRFNEELKKHRQVSQNEKGKFKSGLADNSEATTKLHTATHLLNQALREMLNKDIAQRGSNITPERLRFDFNFERKLTAEEIKKVENLVNKKIKEALIVEKKIMSLKGAKASGAQAEFGARYPEKVSVYSIDNFSREICTGPHVKNTKEIGEIKIIKEESSSRGVRRIKAILV